MILKEFLEKRFPENCYGPNLGDVSRSYITPSSPPPDAPIFMNTVGHVRNGIKCSAYRPSSLLRASLRICLTVTNDCISKSECTIIY